MVLEEILLLPHHVLVIFVRCRTDLTNQVKIELVLDEAITHDLNQIHGHF